MWAARASTACTLILWASLPAASGASSFESDMDSGLLPEIAVTAMREGLLGIATSASVGEIADEELQLAPVYRPGQLLESVPGLIVTSHSGEGKANQYLLRGYNLDHGTDLDTYIDGMPVNQVTHAHGQGYTDVNFLVPELTDGIAYTKGPYYADIGDFGAVGSVRISYRDTIEDELSATIGTLGFQRITAAGTESIGGGHLLGFIEAQHYDGPFQIADDARKENLVLRYSRGDAHNGYAVTGMYYHQAWTNTTDIPVRAIADELVPDRFGSLDPTDAGHAERASLSANYHAVLGGGQFSASGFFIYNQLHMYSDFTHFLFDPVHGDQEDQFETRRVLGGAADYTGSTVIGAIENDFSVGGLTRYDLLGVGRLPSEGQVPRASPADPASLTNNDQVYLFASGAYVQAVTHWTTKLRTVLGLREDYQHGTDVDYLAPLHQTLGYSNGGTQSQSLLQPKGSVIVAPVTNLEFYLSAGRGFHSADLRGVNQDRSVDLGLPHTPLLARQEGQELGLRAAVQPNLAFTAAIYNLWQQSETIMDPDVGVDVAGPPSRRYGYEVNVTYQLNAHLEFYGSYSGNHTRFTRAFDDGTGHSGSFITDAPAATGSLALYFKNLGPWSGGLDYRYLGNYPLSSGPCVNSAALRDFPGVATSCANAPTASGQVNGRGFGELNLDAHYAFSGGWSASVGIYNLLNSRAAAAEFWYVDRLRSEIGAYPEGRADIHEHPLEPITLRFTIAKQFGH